MLLHGEPVNEMSPPCYSEEVRHGVAPSCLFRADASASIGAGHIVRCLSLAYAMARLGWHCRFAVSVETPAVVPGLIDGPFDVDVLDPDTDASPAVIEEGSELLIVDHYELDAAYERRARGWTRGIVVIDELANRPHDCDVLLDQTLNRTEDEHEKWVGEGTHFLLGANYALLREQFTSARDTALAKRQRRQGFLKRVMISMGATDPDNATAELLEALSSGQPDLDITVVLGQGAPHVDSVQALAERIGPRVHLLKGVSDMAALMTEVDLAVAAAGSASYERCCLGLPTLIVTTGPDQEPNAKALDQVGAAVHLGRYNEVRPDQLQAAVRDLRNNPARLQAMQDAAAKVCDGHGANRSAKEITHLATSWGLIDTARLGDGIKSRDSTL